MGSQRDKIEENMRPTVEGLLQPGETIRASAQVLQGPTPWLLGGLGMMLFSRFYFLVVTDRRVLFIRTGGAFAPRPKGLAFSDPLSGDALVEYRPKPLWTVLKYRRPDGTVMRLNLNRLWIPDRDQVAAALRQPPTLPGSSGPATAPQVPPPPA
jgi:hypothetical protein